MAISVCMLLIPVIAACGHAPDSSGITLLQDQQSDSEVELVTRATEAWSAGRYQEAFEAASKICELKPDDIRFQLFLGDVGFAAGKIDESIAAYDAAIRIEPEIEPRLWQRGLALYYADRFADGVQQFETHQTVNSQDVENAVWYLLCAARISDVDKAREKLIPISKDPRVPMAEIYEMFAGRTTPEEVLNAANGTSEDVPENERGHKLQLYYAWLYIGLYQEMLGEQEAALESLKKAEEQNPLGKTNFMGQVARVHLEIRVKAGEKAESSADDNKSQRQPFSADRKTENGSFELPGVPSWLKEHKFNLDSFTFVRIRYEATGQGRALWSTDYPDADLNFAKQLGHVTNLDVSEPSRVLELTDRALSEFPFAYLTEPGSMKLTDHEVVALREYLLAGGFLMMDDFWGEAELANVQKEMKRVFPNREPKGLDLTHPLFDCVFELKEKPQVPSIHTFLRGQATERIDAAEASYRAIVDDHGRMMVLMCHNTDLADGWERAGIDDDYRREMSVAKAFPMGINIVFYALDPNGRGNPDN